MLRLSSSDRSLRAATFLNMYHCRNFTRRHDKFAKRHFGDGPFSSGASIIREDAASNNRKLVTKNSPDRRKVDVSVIVSKNVSHSD
jgi:hypothetical protein